MDKRLINLVFFFNPCCSSFFPPTLLYAKLHLRNFLLMPAWANDIIIYWWFLLIHELYSFNTWIISKVQGWINHQLLGNGKKSEAVGVKVNFKENLKQLLFRHLKNNKFKVKIAGRVKPAKLKQHFNATSCNIVKSSWEMLCRSWPNARDIL